VFKKSVLISYIFLISQFANASDSLNIRRHTIYFIPTGLLFTDWVANDIWLFLGYDYQINKKQFIGVNIGAVIEYEKAGWYDFLATPAEKITGYSINIEHKIIIKKRFYYSTNLLYRQTKFYEKETFSNGIEHQYYILNDIAGLIAKGGFVFFSNKHLFSDIGVGLGVKYINGKTIDRLTQPTISIGDNQGNIFGDESVFKPSFTIQFKIGYNFCLKTNCK
jgi:hypothetical protein